MDPMGETTRSDDPRDIDALLKQLVATDREHTISRCNLENA
jgi:hypothetical protein